MALWGCRCGRATGWAGLGRVGQDESVRTQCHLIRHNQSATTSPAQAVWPGQECTDLQQQASAATLASPKEIMALAGSVGLKPTTSN